LLGELVETTAGKWITHPPTDAQTATASALVRCWWATKPASATAADTPRGPAVHSEAAFEAADGIATVPAFGSWGGDAAEAAKQASEQLRKDLDVHGSEALAVAKAAQRAADDMEQVKSDLAQLEADAAGDGFEVDRASSTVMPGPAMQGNMIDLIAAEAKREELQARLNAILGEAARVDEELARAINWPPALSRSPIPRMTTVGVEDNRHSEVAASVRYGPEGYPSPPSSVWSRSVSAVSWATTDSSSHF
jgi:hypothetical protein